MQKFMDKRKEINTNGWIHLKILSIYFNITLKGIQNFIEKYQHMSTLQAIDCCHVQRCATRQNFK